MDSCCSPMIEDKSELFLCPRCNQKGKEVPLITLKSLLKPTSLETIHPDTSYRFCNNPSCDVVYFSANSTYVRDELKVPVFQKDESQDVPVCYCFGWTRTRIHDAVQAGQKPNEQISGHVKAGRCGCEVNNPQGSCCLGNVTAFIRTLNV
ncbi:(2Fe-2S)-binding protein [Paenibacillus cisolokensis]|uniref:putative iron-sulfur cluster-binding metallochaperone n=1 Tax=Paenibacillus cisolokensis TaxID=1658519 RepID=UPI003D268E13